MIPAGTLLSDQGSGDVPHTLLAGITRMNITECFNCETQLTPVYPLNGHFQQCSDALGITFVGGYGMFFDEFGDNLIDIVLCKECALKFCETFPKLKHFIPSNHFNDIQDIDT